ncbi:hypothetical protein DFJ73DRAFT_765507 [Zopfochytrium polystomum]|nr:hypothetical protein DFJ73DRAFT_765507 [Zopfochytrium polystomum]
MAKNQDVNKSFGQLVDAQSKIVLLNGNQLVSSAVNIAQNTTSLETMLTKHIIAGWRDWTICRRSASTVLWLTVRPSLQEQKKYILCWQVPLASMRLHGNTRSVTSWKAESSSWRAKIRRKVNGLHKTALHFLLCYDLVFLPSWRLGRFCQQKDSRNPPAAVKQSFASLRHAEFREALEKAAASQATQSGWVTKIIKVGEAFMSKCCSKCGACKNCGASRTFHSSECEVTLDPQQQCCLEHLCECRRQTQYCVRRPKLDFVAQILPHGFPRQ